MLVVLQGLPVNLSHGQHVTHASRHTVNLSQASTWQNHQYQS